MHRSDDKIGRHLLAGSFSGRRESLLSLRGLGFVAIAALLLPALFFGGEYMQRYITYSRERKAAPIVRGLDAIDPLRHIVLNTLYELPMPWSNRKLLGSGLPVYDLRIAPKRLKKLQDTAEWVSARSIAMGIPRDYVPAEFWLDGQWLPIDVKLRGLYPYHYLKNHPSLRLKFPRYRLFHGKRQINLLEPYDKGLTVDITTNWELERYDILTWDSEFIILRVNGKVLGLYQEIEQFGRSIYERNGRTEGYIFSGDGQLFGNEGAAFDKATQAIELVKQCQASDDSAAADHCRDWKFINDYFDTDRWAWAAAMSTLVKSRHAWAPDNLRLFWDPSRGKFEPIPWDYSFFEIDPAVDSEGEADYSGYLAESFLSVPEFRQMRDQRLWFVLGARVEKMVAYSEELFDGLKEALTYDVRHPNLAMDVRRQASYVKGLRANKEILMDLFRHHDVRAKFWQDESLLAVELSNHGKSFLSVTEVLFGDPSGHPPLTLDTPVVLDGLWQGTPGRAQFSVSLPLGATAVGLTVRDEVTGSRLEQKDLYVEFVDGKAPLVALPVAIPPLEISLKNVRVEPSRVTFGPGTVELDHVVEIPPSHNVVFAPGLELRMSGGASLHIYGDLTSIGSPKAPIQVRGSQPGTVWGGVFVQGTRVEPSHVRLEHTIIDGGIGGQNERTWFTAPFAVHDGVVLIKSSEFRNGQAEDAINLKNARVDLQDNLFHRSKDDTVDCDFCLGQLLGNRVIGSGGDALDFSGSRVLLSGNVVTNCLDKGMSIGEKTFATIDDNTITGCYTGIAVKDLSDATIRNLRLSQLQVGLALYVKKLSFGPSTASVENVVMEDVATDFLRELSCALEIS